MASTTIFGVSMALGAFIAGMTVGRSDYSLRAATDALPMRDAFAVLFFVSIGMLLDPVALLASPWLTLAALGGGGRRQAARRRHRAGPDALPAAHGAHGAVGARTDWRVLVHPGRVWPATFACCRTRRWTSWLPFRSRRFSSIPVASRAIGPARTAGSRDLRLIRRAAIADTFAERGARSSLEPEDRAVVVGYGPTGRTVARLLRENGVSPTVVELNIDTVRALRDEGVSAVYGDARDPNTLVAAGIRHAATLIVSGADSGAPEMIRVARELNPPSTRVRARGVPSRCAQIARRRRRARVLGRGRSGAGDDRGGAAPPGRHPGSDRPGTPAAAWRAVWPGTPRLELYSRLEARETRSAPSAATQVSDRRQGHLGPVPA